MRMAESSRQRRTSLRGALWGLVMACLLETASSALAATTCPAGALATAKRQRLFLYFPTADDATYPEHGTFGVATSPLRDFDVSDLDSGIGTTAALRNRIFELVTDDYCEFSVKVESSTTMPPQTDPRWQIVGIGSDGNGAGLFGEAQAVDTGDADPQDFARVWADAFGEEFGGAGGALNGTNSTLERWATAIGHTVGHEAAHNYGAAHGHSAPRAGSAEDEQNNHIMATGSTGLTGEMRAGRNRHFSDQEYEILAHNLSLNVKTLTNWDFVNPNDTDANKLVMRLLAPSSTLTLAWSYSGGLSPWTSPSVTSAGTTQVFQGTTFNVFDLTFSTAKAWSGGANGVVPPDVQFHTGATFTEAGPVIVFDAKLFNGTTQLPLFPRLFGFDAGTADLASGDFAVRMFSMQPNRGPLTLRRLEVLHVPRMVNIEAMVTNACPFGVDLVPINPHSRKTVAEGLIVRESASFSLGRLRDKRAVDIVYGEKDCPRGSAGYKQPGGGPGDSNRTELLYCHRGNALSLFPSTYTYLIATVVDPKARHWDARARRFVTGPLETKVFHQLAGFVPDFNKNGVDDLIDIRQGRAKDKNQNGLIDEVERPREGQRPPAGGQ
jgi:hypothetical protein